MDRKPAQHLMPATDLVAACRAWRAFVRAIGGLSPQATPENVNRIMGLLDEVLELLASETPPNGAHDLLTYLTDWVTEYERVHQPVLSADPIELLKHLMEVNGLKQRDLAVDLGGQPVVSELLRGKRQINARQATALGRRFGLSPAAFIADHKAFGPITVLDRTETSSGRVHLTGALILTTLEQPTGGTVGYPKRYDRTSNTH